MKKDIKKSTSKHKAVVHFVDNQLLNPTNPISVNLIGVGGTGSSFLTALVRINKSLVTLGHAGLQVVAHDPDKVEEANLGRQLFTDAELGMNKAVALINRANRAFGTAWKASPKEFDRKSGSAILTITCVDNVAARLEVANNLQKHASNGRYSNTPLYWMDCGNGLDSGQVVLATVGRHEQPPSKKFIAQGKLPMVTEEFGSLLQDSETSSDIPSCSLAEALEKQDLFINTNIANIGASLLWTMFRKGMIRNRGFFINLADFRMQPIKIIEGKK